METITIKDDHIKLGQALKLAGLAESGTDAKTMILEGLVSVNGVPSLQRGKKLCDGDIFEYGGTQVRVCR